MYRRDSLFAHACPDPAMRARWLPWSFLWSLTKGRRYGEVLGIGDLLAGVAITLGPREAAAYDAFDAADGAAFAPTMTTRNTIRTMSQVPMRRV